MPATDRHESEKWPNANFHKNRLKNQNFQKKNFWTNYNFRLLKSIPKFNFLSQKMAVLSPVIFNKDYIAKNSKIGIFSPKMNFSKNKKNAFFSIVPRIT